MPLETILNINTTLMLIWSFQLLFFVIMLFYGQGNGIYIAMRLFLILIMLQFVRVALLTFINVVHNPEPYYVLSFSQMFLAGAGVVSTFWLMYITWKAKR